MYNCFYLRVCAFTSTTNWTGTDSRRNCNELYFSVPLNLNKNFPVLFAFDCSHEINRLKFLIQNSAKCLNAFFVPLKIFYWRQLISNEQVPLPASFTRFLKLVNDKLHSIDCEINVNVITISPITIFIRFVNGMIWLQTKRLRSIRSIAG